MNSNASQHNILIIGAGPVGLFAALRLSHLGVPCTLIASETELAHDLRASTFHPPTLEILDEYGVTEQLIAIGRVCPTWQIRLHPSNERVEFDLSVLRNETRHPYRVQCEQFKLCRILLNLLRERGNVEIRMGIEAMSVEQTDDEAIVFARTASGLETMRARLVVGADGARSVTRKALDLEFQGSTYPETTILATTAFSFEDHLSGLSDINYCWKPEGTFSLLRLPDLWRCSLYPDSNEPIEEATQPASIERKLQAIVAKDTPYDVSNIRPYRIHMRIVNTYNCGRVALAGDAAHLNSPSGGMGMNGGLHDAYMLADTLHKIDQGGDLSILDRYTRQRRPVALEQILKQADGNRKRMQEKDPERRQEIFTTLQEIAKDPERRHEHLMNTSMISGWRRSLEIS